MKMPIAKTPIEKSNNLTPVQRSLRVSVLAGVLALGACASLPPNPRIEELQSRLEIMSSQPYASQEAQSELDETRVALDLGRVAYRKHDEDALAHYLVVADKNLDIAQARIQLYDTNARIASASQVREGLVRDAREREIARAEADARAANREADRTRAELSLQDRELAARNAELRAQELALADKDSQLNEAERKLAVLERQAQLLADQLVELTVVHNERGTVLVVSDVVFDFDSAQLRPGSNNALDEIASFLIDSEEPLIKVEGHTDSVGSHDYNMALSRDRAESVRDALVRRGVPPSSIQVAGYGEEYPVATNDTDEGRQLNRRVEIVLNDRVGRPISQR